MPGLANTDAPPELREGVDSDAESGEDEFVAGLGTEEEAEALWVDPSEGGVLSALHAAAEEGDHNSVAELIPKLKGCGIDALGEDGDTALHLACLYGHAECAKLLLDAGCSGDTKDGNGGVPLHDAAASGYLDIVKMLMGSAPGALSVVDGDGDTPLHTASRGDHGDVVAFLLQAGGGAAKALLQLANSEGRTPADCTTEEHVRAVLEGAMEAT